MLWSVPPDAITRVGLKGACGVVYACGVAYACGEVKMRGGRALVGATVADEVAVVIGDG